MSQENVPQENISQENVSQENVSPENVPQENVPQENVSPENVPQENVSTENVPQENVTQENVSQENLSQENASQENASQEIASQENESQEPSIRSRKRKRSLIEKRHVIFYDEPLSLENFIKAVETNDIQTVESYLQHGQDPNEHTGNFVTPLHIASMHGFHYLVQLLLQHPKIDVNPVDHLGRTPLARACRYNYLDIVKLLLEHNADCNIPDRTGYTPLHHVALWGWSEIMEILLQYDANPNVANAFGKTPLHISCVDNANMSLVQMLCENGADINLECALVMPVLIACCLNCFDYDNINMVDLLIDYDAYINIVYSQNGQTALHAAAISGLVPLAEVLCTAGANPNIMDKLFRTPYDLALQMENDQMVRFLRLFFEEDENIEEHRIQRRKARASILYNRSKRKRNYETF